MSILITGCAGFVGFHVAKKMLDEGSEVIGIDNINSYYSVKLKNDRLNILKKYDKFKFVKVSIDNEKKVFDIFLNNKIDKVCHLAAQAGVRNSFIDPISYVKSNIVGFINIINACKEFGVNNVVFASSSSVYGEGVETPYVESKILGKPLSVYSVTKICDEMLAEIYHNTYKINFIGLRFFTVYGPWGRPDMFYFILADALRNKKTIEVFNYGKTLRDFTYIDDIVDGIISSLEKVDKVKFKIMNLGGGQMIEINKLINMFESNFERIIEKKYIEEKIGDMKITHSNCDLAKNILNFESKIGVEEGMKRFINWYIGYFKIPK